MQVFHELRYRQLCDLDQRYPEGPYGSVPLGWGQRSKISSALINRFSEIVSCKHLGQIGGQSSINLLTDLWVMK